MSARRKVKRVESKSRKPRNKHNLFRRKVNVFKMKWMDCTDCHIKSGRALFFNWKLSGLLLIIFNSSFGVFCFHLCALVFVFLCWKLFVLDLKSLFMHTAHMFHIKSSQRQRSTKHVQQANELCFRYTKSVHTKMIQVLHAVYFRLTTILLYFSNSWYNIK